jgi:photosystem II stability/assembly factor-like uncharacterized protein
VNITHVGPTKSTFAAVGKSHSFSGRMLSLAAAANGTRMYAGSYAGVWRSDDAGQTWRQLTWAQPPSFNEEIVGALFAPAVFDIVVSPIDENLVLACGARGKFVTSRDGIYRSTNGGRTWTRVHVTDPAANEFVSQIVFAPDDPMLVFAAIGSALAISVDAGATWIRRALPGRVWHVAPAPLGGSSQRRIYAAGSNNLYCSLNGGATWVRDLGTTVMTSMASIAGATADNSGSGASVLVVDPSNPMCVFLAGVGGANGPSYYAQRPDGSLIPNGTICNVTPDRPCGEGSLWYGDYTQFAVAGAAVWTQLPGPPVYWGATTPSGNSFVIVKPTPAGFLVFFADESHVHVSVGRPTAASSWHRLDGKDASLTAIENDLHNRLFVHPDPHALVVTADFDLTLKAPTGVTPPFDQNSVLDQHLGGTIWMANDGGVYWSDDGGQTWNLAEGLETVDPVNIAGVAGIGNRPALYMGTGDNDDFCSLDGGQTWLDPNTGCGDCDAWFADIAQPKRVLQFDPRGAGLRMRTANGYPDATSGAQTHNVPAPRNSNASSGPVIAGYRPVIRTLATELPLPDGDYVFIAQNAANERVLLRTTTISAISTQTDWDDPAKAQQVGGPLPPSVNVVQPAGGHANPVFYVADPFGQLFKLASDGVQWTPLVPGGPPGQDASHAWRFYVNPFDARIIYILDDTSVKVSLNGGASWIVAESLTRAVTANGRMTLNQATALNDMLFVRSDPFTAFVFGHAGVSYTYDGVEWRMVLSAIALAGCPEFGFFDGISNPLDRALYVSTTGRSLLKLNPILPRPHSPPQPITLMELAAMLSDA